MWPKCKHNVTRLWLVNCFCSRRKNSNCIVNVQLDLNCGLFTKQNWQIGIRAEAAVDCQSYHRTVVIQLHTVRLLMACMNRMKLRSVHRAREQYISIHMEFKVWHHISYTLTAFNWHLRFHYFWKLFSSISFFPFWSCHFYVILIWMCMFSVPNSRC